MTLYQPDPEDLANGQALRLPGTARAVALHDQLYRYAEDLEQSIARCTALEARNRELLETCDWLEASRQELDELVLSARDIHFTTDTGGIILQCNPAAAAMASPQRLAGENIADWVLPDSIDNCNRLRAEAVSGLMQERSELELHLRRATNDSFSMIVAARAFPVLRKGTIHALHWVLRNITYLRETEFDTQVATMVFKSAAEGVMITDPDGEILAVNPAFTQITGYSADEAIGRNASFLRSGVQDEAFFAEFWLTLRKTGKWQGELYNRKKSGEMFPEWLTISAASDNNGRVLSYVAIFSDISRLLRAEKRLAYLAHYDTLTGLPNRHLFQDRLKQVLANAKRGENPFTLIFIDLDEFKAINDTLGHQAGDRVLQEAGRRLAALLREVDTVARLGGDEFVIIATGLSGNDNIARVCHKTIEALIQPIAHEGKMLKIGGSLGCAEYPRHGSDETSLLKQADMAMYRAKAAGGNSYFISEEGNSLPAQTP
ncbi:MAG: diguanylate cyclase [Gammaproteobacteria bacterium]|nr:diguanylate cyclase [Gammaproteobacteria bacterium]MBU1602750.1 diguanylate cyclase [Gammaproteobacteria bacterium]MBU2432422.1 diguanylate cyclase [Gammaproteobacteria bacterium]MBU2449082.1 diguanylate cyclase [Gammaproteobacteria bacterium]